MQTTLRKPVSLTGTGLHSGRPVRLSILPADIDHGIVFRRSDIAATEGARRATVPARWDAVASVPLCTRLTNGFGVSVSTVEHLMAALSGCGVHNALVELSGPEVPILDGSSAPFVGAILDAGLIRSDAPLRVLRVLKTVEVAGADGAWARLSPSESLSISFEIGFDIPAIGTQALSLDMGNGTFVRELCQSRTFCKRADVEAMRAKGLALGGTLENAVVFEGARILTPGGLRRRDEPVRHKMLDAFGDLALAGAPLLGAYTGFRAGHALTNRLLRALFADPSAARLEVCSAAAERRLPGVGVRLADLSAVA